MSEATRARYLFLKNRLEELLARHGPPDIPPPDGAGCEPTWGPLGSLARQWLDEAAYAALLALDRDMARKGPPQSAQPTPQVEDAQPVAEQPPAQNRVLEAATAMRSLDRYGETPLFGCPVCGEESAKASVPLDLWHCTACSTSGKASSLAPKPQLKATPEHRV